MKKRDIGIGINRRSFLRSSAAGILGGAALGTLLGRERPAAAMPHFEPIARRVVYLFQAGAPSQLETFDYKPGLAAMDGQELPSSVRQDQRLTTMSSNQSSFPLVAPRYSFSQYGESGTWVSELLPHTGAIADKICVIRSMHSESINHEPGMTLMQTGHEIAGRPCIGSWLSYGLGREAENLPLFAVLTSVSRTRRQPQPISARLWGPGFLPAKHQGVSFRSGGDPVLFLNEPHPTSEGHRERIHQARSELDLLGNVHQRDPEVDARIAAYELAFRMQTSVPELTDFASEPESTYQLYGDAARVPGTFAANCLFARRLLERDVPFVQLYHRDWDHHDSMMSDHPILARDTDQAAAALVLDLEQRGMLDDTLVIWGGEFGRTVYGQGLVTPQDFGRDHHGRCFSIWMAGGGIRGGMTYGETDDFSFNIVDRPVHVNDLHATILHLLGFDHTRLTYRYQGRDFRLTDVAGEVLNPILT